MALKVNVLCIKDRAAMGIVPKVGIPWAGGSPRAGGLPRAGIASNIEIHNIKRPSNSCKLMRLLKILVI